MLVFYSTAVEQFTKPTIYVMKKREELKVTICKEMIRTGKH